MDSDLPFICGGRWVKLAFFFIATLLFTLPAFGSAPVCMYQDVQSGPATGGEGGNGIYLNIYGLNFGSSQGKSTVKINGTEVAQYLYWGADPTGDRQQIGVQVASGTTSGAITITTAGGSCSNLSFSVRPGNIYYIGPSIDNSKPESCANLTSANSYSSPWGLTNYASTTESNYNPGTMRTPYTYYECMSPGDTLVFLNGVNYPYFDGRGWHASLTLDNGSTNATHFMTIMARPGATATLGGEGWANVGIRNTGASSYTVYSGLTLIGSGLNGGGLNPDSYDRFVGNAIMCPDCSGPAGAMTGGTGNEALGNLLTSISTDTSVLPNGSNKTYHDAYFQGDNWEFGWNRIYNTAAYNGFQINEDGSSGFFNFSIHDNDIADVNGSGINLSDIDPSSGYVQVYNNIIHHTGVALASDGGSDDPHSCIAVKGYGSTTGSGTAEIYNNTMYDCSSYLNSPGASSGQGESCAVFIPANQLNVTSHLVNNIAYQPAYTYSSVYNVFLCGDGTLGTMSGSNNIWYSAATPGSTEYATAIGKIEDPLYLNAADGSWTNYRLQSSSPAIGTGLNVGPVELGGISNTYLTWDFVQTTRPNPPTIGALEYGSISSQDQITVSATPSPATVGQSVTLTATVGGTTSLIPTGTINFMNGATVLGTAGLNSAGVATLSTASLSAGTYAVVGSYSGDLHYPAGESGAVSLQVRSTTETTLAASPNTVIAGQTLNLTATVSASGTTVPTGTVSFMNGATVLGTTTLNSSGVATLSTASLPAGSYSLTAQYTGAANFVASTSPAAPVTVNPPTATSSTTLVASPNVVTAGQTLNLTATVSASGTTIPTGTVSFMNGSSVLGTTTLNSSGVAVFSTTSLAAGAYSLTARYAGTSSIAASTSPAATVTVNALAVTPTIVLAANPNPVTEGQALILTATVSENGTAVPTGTVSFMNGSTPMGTAALNSSGVATLSITSLAVGTYTLAAQYPSATSPTPLGSGSASPASASATVLVTVNAAPAPITPSFNMTVSGSTPSSVSPGGTAIYSLVVTPTTGTSLPAITFASSGLPTGAVATFSPQKIAEGSPTTNVTLSIQTPAPQSAQLERTIELGRGLPVVALCFLLLPFGRRSRRFGKRITQLSRLLVLLAGATAVAGLTGCGANVYTVAAQTYTITVTSASAQVSQTAQITLAVQ